MNIPYGREIFNFRHYFAWLGDLSSTTINFLHCRETFREFPFTFHAARRTNVNLLCSRRTICQLSVWSQDLPSTFCAPVGPFINFPCCLRNISTSVTILCSQGPSISFQELYEQIRDFFPLSSTFSAAAGPSVNFLCCHSSFRPLPLTFRFTTALSVKFCRKCFMSLE